MTQENSRDARKAATVDVLSRVMQVLYYFLQEKEDGLDDDGVFDDFVSQLWDMAVVAMAASGFRITGVNPDGSYNATFVPLKSVKEFMTQDDYANDDDAFFEDEAELSGVPFFGPHEARFLD